jgi:hypothetical protein
VTTFLYPAKYTSSEPGLVEEPAHTRHSAAPRPLILSGLAFFSLLSLIPIRVVAAYLGSTGFAALLRVYRGNSTTLRV